MSIVLLYSIWNAKGKILNQFNSRLQICVKLKIGRVKSIFI